VPKKRLTGGPRRIATAHEFQTGVEEISKKIAKHNAELRRVSRYLRIVSAYNRALVRTTQVLVRRIELGSEHEIARLRSAKSHNVLHLRYASLTPREREVMHLVVNGLLNKEIAARLGTAEITVKIQRSRMMKKMAAGSVARLARIAEKIGIRVAGEDA
jgi:DNA-binding NarL/FixJ family response regulator